MLENSPVSQKVLEYFNSKYGQMIAPVGLFKLLSCISPFVNEFLPCFNVFTVAPTRQFKSKTSYEVQEMIPKKYFIDLPSDITMNALLSEYKDFNRKCLFINDCTTLFATKSRRTKERLISGLTNLLSEGCWGYGDKTTRVETLKGFVSMVVNLTIESYNKYEKTLLGSTLLERFLTIFYIMPEAEIKHFIENKEEKLKIKWKGKIKFLSNLEVKNLKDYKTTLIDYAKRWSVLSLKSINGCYDMISSMVKSHLALNQREYIKEDELDVLKMTEQYLVNPFSPNQSRIIEFYKQGRSWKDICLLLGKEPEKYKTYVFKVLRKARERGVIS